MNNPIKTFQWRTRLMNQRLWLFLQQWHWLAEKRRVWMLKSQAKRRKKAIQLANLKHQTNGKKYYVLQAPSGAYLVLRKIEIEQYKKDGVISKNVNIYTLLKEAVYITP